MRILSGLPVAALALLAVVASVPDRLCGQTTEYTFSTLAGVGSVAGNQNGSGGGSNLPLFNRPIGIVVNAAGNLYVTDSGNSLVRIVTPAGLVTTLAGSPGRSGSTDGTGVDTDVSFNSPQGPALDSSGNIYLADYLGRTIRKITPAGVVTTIAGTAEVSGSTDGAGNVALFSLPSGVALDAAGNIYVADSGNNIIRKITSAGVVSTFAGTAGTNGSADGTGAAARFATPRGIATDSAGNVYVADTVNNTIRKITPDGVVTTLAGQAGAYGTADGSGSAARFNFPNGLTVDSAGNIYVADVINNAIRKVTPGGIVTTLAGLAGAAEGRVDGTGSAARFARPTGVTVDAAGNVYVADDNNQQIRKVTPAGVVTTIAGTGGVKGTLDGSGSISNPALFFEPTSTATDSAGNVYVADTGNNTIRKVTPAGVVTTIAGNPQAIGRANGNGSSASFNGPGGVAVDGAGNIYVADTGSQLIRLVTPAGDVSTLAGTGGVAGSADGAGTAANFSFPSGVAVDGAGNVYVTDYDNHTIRKIAPGGQVTTLAGTAGNIGHADGQGAAASFSYPRAITVDSAGNLYVTDSGNHTIRKISPGGLVTTLAGSPGVTGNADGSGSAARFYSPSGLAVDSANNVYVADTGSSTVRKVTPAGVVTTLAGLAGTAGNTDGLGSATRFNHPAGIAVDASGNIYVADSRNDTIRMGIPPGGSGGSGGGGSGGGSGGGGSGGGSGGGGSGGGSGGPGSSGGTGGIGSTNSSSTTGRGFLLHPSGIRADSAGNLYVTDTANNCIKQIATDGTVTVFAGKSGTTGSTDGTGTAALFNGPMGLVMDTSNNLYVCDTGNATIRKITPGQVVTTIAGSAGSKGSQDGTGSAALFSNPTDIAMDGSGNLYVSDSNNNTIRQITSAGVVTTYAGTVNTVGDRDGTRKNALFNNPTGLVFDNSGNLYVTDTYNNTIRKITTAQRVVSTIAVGTIVDSGNAMVVLTDAALTGSPIITTVPVLAGDTSNVWATKVVTALAGNALIAGRYTAANNGNFITLTYLTTVDDSSTANLSLDNGTCTGITPAPTSSITTPSGTVSTLAGSAGISGVFDGNGIYALFNLPAGIAVDINSNLFVADTGNNCIRKITPNGVVTTIAGIAGISGSRDGIGTSALFNQPQALYYTGGLAIVDTGNSLIRVLDATQTVVTTLSMKQPTTTTTTPPPTTPSTGYGSGGGSIDPWFLGALLMLAGVGYKRRQWAKAGAKEA